MKRGKPMNHLTTFGQLIGHDYYNNGSVVVVGDDDSCGGENYSDDD